MREKRIYIRLFVIMFLVFIVIGLTTVTSTFAVSPSMQENLVDSAMQPPALEFKEDWRGLTPANTNHTDKCIYDDTASMRGRTGIASLSSPECTGGKTQRISVSTEGVEGNLNSGLDRDIYEMYQVAVSASARFIAFSSEASNLVADDTNGHRDIFLRDRDTDNDGIFDEPSNVSTTRISVGYGGSEANNDSWEVSISYDGRYIVFSSDASNIVESDTNGVRDIFRYDRISGDTIRVSLSENNNVEGNSTSSQPFISGDGNIVAFRSTANNLTPWDSNNADDIFVREISSGLTFRVSEATGGVEANGASYAPTISYTGRFIAFGSSATNLDADDGDAFRDVFIHDRTLNTTTLVSVSTLGIKGNLNSYTPFISGDGNFIVFASEASNLDDTASDINGFADIYVRDLSLLETTRISLGFSGSESDGVSYTPSISQDGRFIIFASEATNLDATHNNGNGVRNIYVHERQVMLDGTYTSGVSSLISLDVNGNLPSDSSFAPMVAANGNHVAYVSEAANLVEADGNSHWDIFTFFSYDCPKTALIYLPFINKQKPPPPPVCENNILNGGFEEMDVAWAIPNTSYPAKYTASVYFTGAMSMRTGINLADNIQSYSSAWQFVTIPNDATSAILSFYYKPQTTEAQALRLVSNVASLSKLSFDDMESAPPWDQQMALILNEDTTHDRTLMSILSNTRTWTASNDFDLMDYKGKIIWVAFTTYNDGINGKTAMYIDDVTLEICR